jgi:hypothetical protein
VFAVDAAQVSCLDVPQKLLVRFPLSRMVSPTRLLRHGENSAQVDRRCGVQTQLYQKQHAEEVDLEGTLSYHLELLDLEGYRDQSQQMEWLNPADGQNQKAKETCDQDSN